MTKALKDLLEKKIDQRFPEITASALRSGIKARAMGILKDKTKLAEELKWAEETTALPGPDVRRFVKKIFEEAAGTGST